MVILLLQSISAVTVFLNNIRRRATSTLPILINCTYCSCSAYKLVLFHLAVLQGKNSNLSTLKIIYLSKFIGPQVILVMTAFTRWILLTKAYYHWILFIYFMTSRTHFKCIFENFCVYVCVYNVYYVINITQMFAKVHL